MAGSLRLRAAVDPRRRRGEGDRPGALHGRLGFPGLPTPACCSPAEPMPGSSGSTHPGPRTARRPRGLTQATSRLAATARSTTSSTGRCSPGRRALRGRGRRRGRRPDAGAGRGRRRPRSRSSTRTCRPILDVEAALEPGSPLVHEAVDDVRPRPEPRAGRQRRRPLDDRQGRRRRRAGRARRSSSASATSPTWPTRSRSSRTAVTADWSGDRVTIYSSTQVPFYARGKTAEVLEIARAPDPRRRQPPRRRVRRQVRLPLRGPRRRARPGRPATGPARPQPARGVHRARQGDARDGRRPRDRASPRTGRSSPGRRGSSSIAAPTPATRRSSARSRR